MYERIIELLVSNKISARRLEIELGFTKDTIGRMRNHMPSVDKIAKIAEYFNVSMEYLFYGRENTIIVRKNTNPYQEKNEKDLLEMLYSFEDIRMQTIFVGRVSVIAEQMKMTKNEEKLEIS